MSEWQPIETAPKDGTRIRVRLSSGRECEAEYWEGPEDKPEWGGWAIDFLPSLVDRTHHEDGNAEIISWSATAPTTQGEQG